MRLAVVCFLAVACGCTAIRPLDPIDHDAGGGHDAGESDAAIVIDAGTDAPMIVDAGHDASSDAWAPDAWEGDANCPLEICGGGDEDCDGMVDEADAVGAMAYYLDMDGDGYGADASLMMSCVQPPNMGAGRWVTRGGDCDDTNPTVRPGRSDISCNGLDDECDGVVDDTSTMCGFGCTIRHYMGNAYAFCLTVRTESEAAAQCMSLGYHLADIGDQGENDFIAMTLAGLLGGGQNGVWIGLMQSATNAYTWTDGSTATYTNWDVAQGEPNHTGPCVRIRSSGLWADFTCTQSFPYVCEAP